MASINELKTKYIKETEQEQHSTHPADSPSSLLCPIGGVFMKHPVITPEGKVYDQEFIEKSLQRKQEDPLSRNKLQKKDLVSFDELSPYIESFIHQQKIFLKRKKELLQEARQIAHQSPAPENPSLFLCPISKTLIKTAVISADGRVYDKESLKNNKDAPKVVDFREFQQFINLYKSNRPAASSSSIITERRAKEPAQGTQQWLVLFDSSLATLREKIGQVDQHYLPEAHSKANELLEVLQRARSDYFIDLRKPNFNEQKAAEQFKQKCADKIKEVKPVLANDLGWDEYLNNFLNLIRNMVIGSFSSNPHSFYTVKRSSSLEAVEQAEKELGLNIKPLN